MSEDQPLNNATTTLRVRIFYEFNGPSKSDPLRTPKSSDEVARAFSYFPNELGHRLDTSDSVQIEESEQGASKMTVLINSSLEKEEVLRRLKITMNDWDLFGKILED